MKKEEEMHLLQRKSTFNRVESIVHE